MKKLILMSLMMGSFYSYAQNPVYGTYIKAIDSLDAANIKISVNAITATNANGGITIDADNTGEVSVEDISFLTSFIRHKDANDANIRIEGGLQNNGGGVVFYGSTHTTKPSQIDFISNTSIYANMSAAGDWDFNTNSLTDIGSLTVDNLTLDASTISSQFATLRSNTPDAADNGQIAIAGGGAIGNGRGAYILLDGNESANDGLLSFVTGDDANALMTFRTGATVTPRLSINASGIFDFNTNSLTDIGSLAVDQVQIDGNDITSTTSDASDNLNVILSGGGAFGTDRGGYVAVNGNEASGAGDVIIQSGNVASSEVLIQLTDAASVLRVSDGSNDIVTVNRSTNGNIVLDPNGTGILDVESNLSLSDNDLLDVGSGTVASGSFYETGTFTPTVVGSSVAGTATYSIQSGRFTRIGNSVNVYIILIYTGGTGTGNLQVSGLPFTSINPAASYAPPISLRLSDIALTASNAYTGFINPNSTVLVPRQYPVGGGTETNITYDAAGTIVINGTYETTY